MYPDSKISRISYPIIDRSVLKDSFDSKPVLLWKRCCRYVKGFDKSEMIKGTCNPSLKNFISKRCLTADCQLEIIKNLALVIQCHNGDSNYKKFN